jgi:hypothetical protein
MHMPGGGMQISLHHENVTQPGHNKLQYYYSANLPAMKLACAVPDIFSVVSLRDS